MRSTSARACVSCPICSALLQGPSCHSPHHELSDQNDITQRPGCHAFWGAWPAQQLGHALAETCYGVQGWAVRAASFPACTAAQASRCAGWPAQWTVAADTLKGGGGGNARPCSCMAASSACIFSAFPSLKQPPSWSGPALAHHSVVGDAMCVSITDTQSWIRCRLDISGLLCRYLVECSVPSHKDLTVPAQIEVPHLADHPAAAEAFRSCLQVLTLDLQV